MKKCKNKSWKSKNQEGSFLSYAVDMYGSKYVLDADICKDTLYLRTNVQIKLEVFFAG